MEMVCKMLPAKEEKKKGAFYVVDTANPIEKNLCTKSDVEAANNNNWLVYNYKNKENNGKNIYEGVETPTGINQTESTRSFYVSFANNGLLKITTPQNLQGKNILIYDIKGNVLKQDVCKGGSQNLIIPKADIQDIIFIQIADKTIKCINQ